MAKAIVVGTIAVEIPPSPFRTCLVLANIDTTNKVYWGQTEEVTTSSGIPIFPESMQVFMQSQGDNPHKAKYLIASADTEVRMNEEEVIPTSAQWRKKFGSEEEIRAACSVGREVEDEEGEVNVYA